MSPLRRLRTILAIALLALLVPMAASADAPTESTTILVHEDVPNPCRPGEVQTVTIVFTIATHEHPNVKVRVISSELTQTDGFVGSGRQTSIHHHGLERVNVKHRLHHPDTGERFSVTIRLWEDETTGEILSGSPVPAMRCIRGRA